MEKKKKMLSEYFSKEEMCYSWIAVENAIDNEPPEFELGAMEYLAVRLLDPLRKAYGKPIAILSGYRNRIVNQLAGGVKDSQHVRGEAVDCYAEDVTELLTVLRTSGLVFDQAILYCKRKFLHLSLKKKGVNRMQILLHLCCLIFVLSGCSSRKSAGWQANLLYKDTVKMSLMDASCKKTSIRYTDTVNWKIREVVYSSPDSLGRQYPEKVIDILVDKHSRQEGAGEVVQEVKQNYQHGQVLHSEEKSLPPQGRNRTVILQVGCLVILGILFFELRRRRLRSV